MCGSPRLAINHPNTPPHDQLEEKLAFHRRPRFPNYPVCDANGRRTKVSHVNQFRSELTFGVPCRSPLILHTLQFCANWTSENDLPQSQNLVECANGKFSHISFIHAPLIKASTTVLLVLTTVETSWKMSSASSSMITSWTHLSVQKKHLAPSPNWTHTAALKSCLSSFSKGSNKMFQARFFAGLAFHAHRSRRAEFISLHKPDNLNTKPNNLIHKSLSHKFDIFLRKGQSPNNYKAPSIIRKSLHMYRHWFSPGSTHTVLNSLFSALLFIQVIMACNSVFSWQPQILQIHSFSEVLLHLLFLVARELVATLQPKIRIFSRTLHFQKWPKRVDHQQHWWSWMPMGYPSYAGWSRVYKHYIARKPQIYQKATRHSPQYKLRGSSVCNFHLCENWNG